MISDSRIGSELCAQDAQGRVATPNPARCEPPRSRIAQDGGAVELDSGRVAQVVAHVRRVARPLRQELRTRLPGFVDLDESSREQFTRHMAEVSDAQLIALASQILEIPSQRKQALLEAKTLSERFQMVYEDLYRHLDTNPEFGSFSPEELN